MQIYHFSLRLHYNIECFSSYFLKIIDESREIFDGHFVLWAILNNFTFMLSNLQYNIKSFSLIFLKTINESREILIKNLSFSSQIYTYTIISNVFHHIFLKSSIRVREILDRYLRFWAFWKAFTIFLLNLHYNIKRFSSIFIKIIHESRVILMIILDFEPFELDFWLISNFFEKNTFLLSNLQ